MVNRKFCPSCGSKINDNDADFCSECGCKLYSPTQEIKSNSKGFFDNLAEKTSFPIIIFSFIIFGIFLFIGSICWSSFVSHGSIDLITYLILVIVFSVFFGGIFNGYYACNDSSYILPNFLMYLGSIFAVVSCGIGLIFTFLMGIMSALSSVLPLGSSSPSYSSSPYASSYQSSTSSYMPSIDLSLIFKILLFILLIPVAAYLGIYLGYILRENI